jgi:hypothetical protein
MAWRSRVEATSAPISPSVAVLAACSRAAASIRTRSVTSRAIFDAPTTRPVSLRIGDTVSETESVVPSFRWRTVS